MADINVKKALYTWLAQLPKAQVPVKDAPRMRAYKQLFDNLAAHNLSPQEVEEFVLANERQIIEMSYNTSHGSAKKWKERCEANLHTVLGDFNPDITAATESESKLEKLEITEEAKEPEIPREYKRIGKPFDDSSEGVPKPDIVVDKELSKLLGFDDE